MSLVPMLATPGELPTGTQWTYEVKWDGMRVLAEVAPAGLRLRSRAGRDVSVSFPELAPLTGTVSDAVLDGEVVALSGGVPSFAALAMRMHVRDRRRAEQLARRVPVTYVVFDVLRLYGVDLTARSFDERRATLERLALPAQRFQLSPLYDDGASLLAATAEQGLEGVVAKRRSSRYQPGRRGDWVKVAHRRTQSALVGGWRPETGGTTRIGALLLGVPGVDGGLRFVGRVGSGITGATQVELRRRLEPLHVKASPFVDPVPRLDADGATWCAPRAVVEVLHLGHTPGGRLRQPVFRGLRTDLTPDQVRPE